MKRVNKDCQRFFFLQIVRKHSSTTTTTTPPPSIENMDYTSSSPPPPSDRYSYNPSLRWDPQVEEYFVNAYGAHQFARISQALARPSRYSCIRVNPLRTTSDAVIEKLLAILNETRLSTDAACMSINGSNTSQVGFGEEKHLDSSSDMHSKQDALLTGIEETSIEKLQTPPIYKCRLPGMNNVVFVKGTGPYMLEYEDGTSRPLKEVIVSRKCAESVLRGAQVFVPGVLACSAHVEKGDEVAISVAVEQLESDNEWAVGITRGTVLHGSQTDPHYDERKGLYIGKGTAMMSRAGIFRASEGIAVNLTERVYNLLSFHDVLEGEIFLQNLPSIVAAHVLDPQEGERILDMCAAPGGKTTAIAILMRDKGELIAIDRSHNKVMNILNLGAEMGLTCISAFRLDALKAVRNKSDTVDIGVTDTNKESSFNEDKESKTAEYLSNDMDSSVENCALTLTSDKCGLHGKVNQNSCMSKSDIRKNTRQMRNGPGRNHCMGSRVENSKGFLPHTFDRVLLDAPCSALGLRPRLFAGDETIESLRNHARYQRKMFDQAVQLVRRGGVIVYSTCTINPGENEALVRYALDTYKFLSLAPQHPRIGGPGLIGHCELFGGTCMEKWLTPSESELVQRFDPSSSSLDTIGFFIAKFNVGKKDFSL